MDRYFIVYVENDCIREKVFSTNLVSTDMVWLADYFGCTYGSDGIKNRVKYDFKNGSILNVPILDSSKWGFECEVTKIIELDYSHIFISKIKNIQIEEKFKDMDMQMIDLVQLSPFLYARYNYFRISEKLGNFGDLEKHLLKLD